MADKLKSLGRAPNPTNSPASFAGWVEKWNGRNRLIDIVTATIDPASVAAQTTVEEAFTVAGVDNGDYVIAIKPTLSAGLAVGQCRVTAKNQVTITFINASTGAVDAGSEEYTFIVIRN